MVNSDAGLDPQAYVLTPESVITIAEAIVRAPMPLEAGRAAALTGSAFDPRSAPGQRLKVPPRELPWLDRIQKAVEAIPSGEAEFMAK